MRRRSFRYCHRWDYDCGPSAPFRRLTSAHEELASYIDASAVKRAWTASASPRMEYETGPGRMCECEA